MEKLDHLVAQAVAAQDSGLPEEAAALWRTVRERDPHHELGWATECALLLQLGRPEQAEATILAAMAVRPDSLMIAAGACVVAAMRQEWVEAATRLARLDRDFTTHPYHGSAVPDLRRTIDQGLVSIGRQRLETLAIAADQAGDPERSALIWRHLFGQKQGRAGDALHGLLALRAAGRLNAAERLCGEALAAHPGDLALLLQSAELAVLRQDWSQAASRWQSVLRNHPAPLSLAPFAAPAFLEAGELDLADLWLEAAMAAEPENAPSLQPLLFLHAGVAERRQHHRQAVARWSAIARGHTDDPGVRYMWGAAMREVGLQRLELGDWDDRDSLAPWLDGEALETARTALRFLAFGSGCELGSAQRQLGAEPLDLFRFCSVGAGDLADLLDHGLLPFDDPDMMSLSTLDSGEYFVGLKDGRANGHGFAYRDRVEPEPFFALHASRTGLLAQKLLRDLSAGERVLLHNAPDGRIEDETILRLHRAASRYGRNRLLVTRAAEDGHPEGSISTLAPDVYVGHLWTGYGPDRVEPTVPQWERFLTHARTVILEQAGRA